MMKININNKAEVILARAKLDHSKKVYKNLMTPGNKDRLGFYHKIMNGKYEVETDESVLE